MNHAIETAQHGNAKAVEYQIHLDNSTKLSGLTEAGLALVPVPPINGKPTKAPKLKGWNQPRSLENPDGYTANINELCKYDSDINFGLHHGSNNTLALDLDDLELARKVFKELTDIQLKDWLEDDFRAEIKSPKPNRGKLIFKLPEGFKAPGVKQCKHDGGVVFELRCGDGAQDVIIGQHPEGGNYQFIGNPAAIPEIPEILFDMLQHWDAWKPCFDSVLGVEQEPMKTASRTLAEADLLPGRRDPIQEFNQSYSVHEILVRNGYILKKDSDRFLRPGSESKAPAAELMRNCADGVERIYSHGGDALNDGFAHDAFDCYRLLECGGDFNVAMNWNTDITKHNQLLYMQEQANNPLHLSTARPPFSLISGYDLARRSMKIDWLVKGIIEACSTNMLFGEAAAGKSLFALEWAFCIAAGLEWHGHKTEKGDVVVIVGEGFAGLARRLKALEIKYGIETPCNLYVSERPAQLDDSNNAAWVAEAVSSACSNPALVIVDTLHRNVVCDENSSKEIGVFVSNLDQYFKPLGVAVLIVHHSGLGDKTRARGSSSIRAAMDAEFCVSKQGSISILSCTKAKDFEPFDDLSFGVLPVELGLFNEENEPVTSVHLVEVSMEVSPKKKKLSAKSNAVLAELGRIEGSCQVTEIPDEMKAKYPDVFTGGNLEPIVVHIDDWRDAVYPVLDVDSDPAKQLEAKRQAFRRARNQLKDFNLVGHHGDYWWRSPVWSD